MTSPSRSPSAFSHLECSRTGETVDADGLRNLSAAGAPLLARYDLERARATLRPGQRDARARSLWRYAEVLPDPGAAGPVTLDEGLTPLVATPRLGRRLGVPGLLIKDESRNPLGSFKDRGMSVAVSMARALGARALAIPTAGNAGGSAAAYAARAGLAAHVFMPADAEHANVREVERAGAALTLVDGFLHDCARIVARRAPTEGWFDVSTFKEPYRVEGKKTMGYELVEALGDVPDVILYPTGGGTGLVGMWKAFEEMEALGWLGRRRPRMVCVQATGCAPLARAFEAGAETAEVWESPTTHVHGLRAPRVLADFLCLNAIRASEGTAIAVSDEAMHAMQTTAASAEGLSICPEGAACLVALERLREAGWLGADERVVAFNTASALKYA
ncbi:MAG: threonine synthase [Ectothiorhodospiraceae bacterium]|nr:threonine synthase [Ectothiorhodospiraceae bacterium]